MNRFLKILCAACAVSILGLYASSKSGNSVLIGELIPNKVCMSKIESFHEYRASHSSTLLPDGRVLIAGGFKKASDHMGQIYSKTTELYDPVKRVFTYSGELNEARCGQTATLLPGGFVLITGGNNDNERLRSAELYNIQQGTWTRLPDMLTGREGHQALLLRNGKVLIIGGAGDPELFAEIFDPATRRFQRAGKSPMNVVGPLAIMLQDGTVLIAGGELGREPVPYAMLYDPAADRFTRVGDMQFARNKSGAALLGNGNALVIGGANNQGWRGMYSSTEIYDIHKKIFVKGPELNFKRFKLINSVITLKDGTILVTGGNQHIEAIPPTGTAFTVAAGLDQPYYYSSATLLPSGEVLMTGGYGNDAQPTNKAWRFLPGCR